MNSTSKMKAVPGPSLHNLSSFLIAVVLKYFYTQLHLGSSVQAENLKVPACKMKLMSGIISFNNHPPTHLPPMFGSLYLCMN